MLRASDACTVEQRIVNQQIESSERNAAAKVLFEEYFAGTIAWPAINDCLASSPMEESFRQTLNRVFLERTLDRLRGSSSQTIQRLIQRIDDQIGKNRRIIFQVTGHFQSEAPTPYRAGVERQNGFVYVDFQRVRADEWFIIFVHEFLHRVDTTLSEAVTIYNDPQIIQDLRASAETTSDPEALPRKEQEELNRWIEAGLNRGLWAEYRAWNLTFAIYQEGLSEGLWSHVQWLDQILAGCSSAQSFDLYIYEFLDARFSNPQDGDFAKSLIRTQFLKTRGFFGQSTGKVPSLGSLEGLKRQKPKS